MRIAFHDKLSRMAALAAAAGMCGIFPASSAMAGAIGIGDNEVGGVHVSQGASTTLSEDGREILQVGRRFAYSSAVESKPAAGLNFAGGLSPCHNALLPNIELSPCFRELFLIKFSKLQRGI